jgi:hypothetical protein
MILPKRKELLATAVVFFTAWYVPFFHVSLLVFFIISNATRPCCSSIVTSAAPSITRVYRRYSRYIRYLVRSVMYHICSQRAECTVLHVCSPVHIVQYQDNLSYVRCKSSEFNTTVVRLICIAICFRIKTGLGFWKVVESRLLLVESSADLINTSVPSTRVVSNEAVPDCCWHLFLPSTDDRLHYST